MVGAVDDGDGAAPVALARDQPVAQPVVDCALADALLLEPLDGAVLGGGDVETVEEAAVDLDAVARVGRRRRRPILGRLHGADDGRSCRRANSQSRSSSAGTAMMAPGAVAHEDVVGHVERDGLPVKGLMTGCR